MSAQFSPCERPGRTALAPVVACLRSGELRHQHPHRPCSGATFARSRRAMVARLCSPEVAA
jgi:hypothetical protein